MGRNVDVDDLVGVSEIAQRLGLKNAGMVSGWRRHYADFPEPVAKLRIGNVYAFADVEAWAKATTPRT